MPRTNLYRCHLLAAPRVCTTIRLSCEGPQPSRASALFFRSARDQTGAARHRGAGSTEQKEDHVANAFGFIFRCSHVRGSPGRRPARTCARWRRGPRNHRTANRRQPAHPGPASHANRHHAKRRRAANPDPAITRRRQQAQRRHGRGPKKYPGFLRRFRRAPGHHGHSSPGPLR